MADKSLSLTKESLGHWLCFDGTQPHYSEPYQGQRYSIVAFRHNSTATLGSESLEFLRDLGFVLPEMAASGPLKLQGDVVHDAVQPELKQPEAVQPEPKQPEPTETRTQTETKRLEPSITTTDQHQEHHSEAPKTKRPNNNLSIGDVINLTSDMIYELEMLMKKRRWNEPPKTHLAGNSVTLGVEVKNGIPRLSPQTEQEVNLLGILNNMFKQLLGPRQFRWSTTQIEQNTVTRPQVCSTHVGPALMLLLGNFKGGTFRPTDGVVTLSEPNKVLVFDPRKPYLS